MQSLKILQENHVVYELECWDRVMLKVRAPRFFTGGGVANFIRFQLGWNSPDTRAFVGFRNQLIEDIEIFAEELGIEIHRFSKEEKNGAKEKCAQRTLALLQENGDFTEGIVFIGKAQEKTAAWRSHWSEGYCEVKRANLMVNWYYVYFYDRDFGLCSLKICSYAPFQMKLYFNGHEYLKQQLRAEEIGFEPLANGILSCEDPERAQQIVKELDARKIEALREKWMKVIPNVLIEISAYYHERLMTSMDQVEVAKTQIWDNPRRGREFFEQAIKENIDLGRPDKCGFIFKKQHRSNGKQEQFHSRVMTYGVIAVFAIYVMGNKLKQYFKEGRGLRSEFTANNLRDLGIGNTLTQENWQQLWATGHDCIGRTLDIEKLSHDPSEGRNAIEELESPITKNGRRVSGMPRGKARTQALLEGVVSVSLTLGRFQNRDLRSQMATLLGKDQQEITQGQMSYDLRRLIGHGIIEKVEGTNRYKATTNGLRMAIWLTRSEKKMNGEVLSGLLIEEDQVVDGKSLQRMKSSLELFERSMEQYMDENKLIV